MGSWPFGNYLALRVKSQLKDVPTSESKSSSEPKALPVPQASHQSGREQFIQHHSAKLPSWPEGCAYSQQCSGRAGSGQVLLSSSLVHFQPAGSTIHSIPNTPRPFNSHRHLPSLDSSPFSSAPLTVHNWTCYYTCLFQPTVHSNSKGLETFQVEIKVPGKGGGTSKEGMDAPHSPCLPCLRPLFHVALLKLHPL